MFWADFGSDNGSQYCPQTKDTIVSLPKKMPQAGPNTTIFCFIKWRPPIKTIVHSIKKNSSIVKIANRSMYSNINKESNMNRANRRKRYYSVKFNQHHICHCDKKNEQGKCREHLITGIQRFPWFKSLGKYFVGGIISTHKAFWTRQSMSYPSKLSLKHFRNFNPWVTASAAIFYSLPSQSVCYRLHSCSHSITVFQA